jgi:GNAT superfamily N-acetyltransferase
MTELIAMAEAVEVRALADLVHAAPEIVRQQAGLAIEAGGSGCIVSATGLDSVLFNRAVGLSGGELLAVSRALHHYRRRGIVRFLLQLGAAAREGEVAELLRGHGVERYRRAWDLLVRSARQEAPRAATELVIREAKAADAGPCSRILADAFDVDARAAGLFTPLFARPRWHAVVACAPDDPIGAPVAVGLLFVDGEVGTLAFGATRPSYRRRGAQQALMVARIRAAAARGCRWLTTQTGEPLAGEPSSSRNNMLRCGFHVAQRRDNYAPIGASWAPARSAG